MLPLCQSLIQPGALLVLLVAHACLVPYAARAQTSLQLHGYVKNLGIRSASSITDKPFFLSLGRHRAAGRMHAGGRFVAEAWLDTEFLFGSFLETDEFALSKEFDPPQRLDLNWTVAAGDAVEIHQQLFRALATVYFGQSHVTLGRQRIAWGTGFAWNPTDIINPFNPGAIEAGERSGADAAYASLQLNATSRLELVGALGDHSNVFGARASTNFRSYDVSVMGAAIGSSWLAGADFAGYLGGAGLRGEAAYSSSTRTVRTVLNADYSFAAGIYGLVEWYFNGEGAGDKRNYDRSSSGLVRTFSLARHYGALSVSASLTPLIGGGVYGLANLNDGSVLAGPSLVFSLAPNLELAASTYFFLGGPGTEYGDSHHVFFGALQWFY